MEPLEVAKLVELIEDARYLTQHEREKIADYIRHSAPLSVLRNLEAPILDLCNKCEERELLSQETHDVRNALTTLYGYEVLNYV